MKCNSYGLSVLCVKLALNWSTLIRQFGATNFLSLFMHFFSKKIMKKLPYVMISSRGLWLFHLCLPRCTYSPRGFPCQHSHGLRPLPHVWQAGNLRMLGFNLGFCWPPHTVHPIVTTRAAGRDLQTLGSRPLMSENLPDHWQAWRQACMAGISVGP